MSELGDLITNMTTRLLEQEDVAAARAACESGTFPVALWTAVEAAGLPALLVPEAAGGSGLGIEDAVAVATVLGEHAAPIPLVETMLARSLLDDAGLPPTEGPLTVALAAEPQLPRLADGRLRGTLHAVPFARHAARIAVVARAEEGLALALVSDSAGIAPERNLAGEPRDRVEVDTAPEAWRRLPPGLDAEAILARAALLRAAQLVGAMEGAAALTRRYAGERSQFGRRLAQFQAIQHQLAVLATHLAACRVAVMTASRRAAGPTTTFDAAVAKARASEAAALVAAIAHQVHGAMGFTHEYGLHHWTKRLWSWRDDWGDERFWQGWLGGRALGSPDLWSLVTAHQDA